MSTSHPTFAPCAPLGSQTPPATSKMEQTILVRALPPQPRARTGATALSTASTAALLAEPRGPARARAVQDTVVPTARLQTPVLPPQPRARTGATALSTASTAALLGGPRGRARARHATQVTKVTTVILRFCARQINVSSRKRAPRVPPELRTPQVTTRVDQTRRARRIRRRQIRPRRRIRPRPHCPRALLSRLRRQTMSRRRCLIHVQQFQSCLVSWWVSRPWRTRLRAL